jgi:predicted secreted hydrolase
VSQRAPADAGRLRRARADGALVRALLLMVAAVPLALSAATPPFPEVVPGVRLQFPRDHGSHPDFRIEWWYVTGWIYTRSAREPLGFELTVFRVRPQIDTDNPSAFAPRQILFAHCAISDPAHGRLWQAQQIRRAGFSLAQADAGDLRVWLDDWRLERRADHAADRFALRADSPQCGLDLTLVATEPPLPNGAGGYSRKGPHPASASEYYSEPHLRVSGRVRRAARVDQVSGEAWLDHEWASEYLDPSASGWDWTGINLDDGGALMAFEIRDRRGMRYWAAGTLRDARGRTQSFGPDAVEFTPLRWWRSARSGTRYPVAERVRVGSSVFELAPLLDDQEFDARATAAALYWEGAVYASSGGQPRGRGYLELTGYDRPLTLP